jgi:hypothetical protein
MKRIFLLTALSAILFSCKKDDDKNNVEVGPQVSVHDGKSWSWIHVDKNNTPLELGISINEAALNSVPVGEGGGDDHHNMDNNLFVALPAKAKEVTPFKTIMLNWNPSGHEPNQIYTLPHFDIHFFMANEQQVMGMTEMGKILSEPAAEYLPQQHMAGAPVPQMGLHWIDVTSPELQPGNTFTQTFIYGSYDSKVMFYEPMITLDFLKNTAHFERSIPQPAKFQQAGYYPTKMKVQKANGATHVILTDFVQRQAS